MSGFDGNGIFDLPDNWPGNPGDVIQSNHALEFSQVIKTGFQNVLTRDGQNEPSNDLPMGGHRHTGVADATADSNYLTLKQFRNNSAIYATTTGADNAYILTLNPAIFAYVAGQEFIIKTNFTTTNATPTININGLGVKNLKNATGGSLEVGSIINNTIYKIFYDGTDFRIMDLSLPGMPMVAKSLTLIKNSSSDIYSPIYWFRHNSTVADAVVDFIERPTSDVTGSNSQIATAGQTVFKVPVFVLQASDLQVKVNNTIVTNYTISNVGYRNGEMVVTFATAVATGATVLFERINLNNYRPLMSIGVFDPTDKTKKASYIDLSVGNVEFNRGIRLPVNPNMTVTDQLNHIYDCNGVVRHCGEVSALGVLTDPRGVLSVSKTGTGQYVITCGRTFPVATTFAVNPYVVSNINAYVSAGSVGTNAFTVQTRNASTNTLVDAAFCFAVFY